MGDRVSNTVEDYLKAIYRLSGEGERVKTSKLAETLSVSPASITDMVQRLSAEDPPLVDYRKHHGVLLTGEGEHIALGVLRRHRLLELFLHEVLGYSWDKVHDEAEALEHVISEHFGERVAEVLGEPTRGLHGSPIPTRDLKMPEDESVCLHDLRPGEGGVLVSVREEDPGLLRYLQEQGLVIGSHLAVVDYSPYDHNLTIQTERQDYPIVLGASVTAQLFVDQEE